MDSIKLFQRYFHTGIGGRDATILASMERYRIKELLTHDEAFKRIDKIREIDPLEV